MQIMFTISQRAYLHIPCLDKIPVVLQELVCSEEMLKSVNFSHKSMI